MSLNNSKPSNSTGQINYQNMIPECSHNLDQARRSQNILTQESNTSNEIANTTYNQYSTPEAPKSLSTTPYILTTKNSKISQNSIALATGMKCIQTAITTQPFLSDGAPQNSARNRPQPLFLQALSKLNENSINCAVQQLKHVTPQPTLASSKIFNFGTKCTELSPPDSLTSAPPSYSFVLRQMAARRPRLMGTFIPSPSFVQHTPPPNYATAFDLYVDNAIPPPAPARVYTFGFAPMPVVCPECGFTGMTVTTAKITLCTHMCSLLFCLFCCWVCAPLPYVMPSCKDVYHYCRNCRHFLGMYCPTSPETRYP